MGEVVGYQTGQVMTPPCSLEGHACMNACMCARARARACVCVCVCAYEVTLCWGGHHHPTLAASSAVVPNFLEAAGRVAMSCQKWRSASSAEMPVVSGHVADVSAWYSSIVSCESSNCSKP